MTLSTRPFERVPLVHDVLADLDTPLSCYLKLARGPNSWLFESVLGGEKWGRYSIIGLPARRRYEFRHGRVQVSEAGQVVEETAASDPFEYARALLARYRVAAAPGLPRFSGGLVGYFGYDTVQAIEPRLRPGSGVVSGGGDAKPDPLNLPDCVLLACEDLVVFDNLAGRLKLITHVDPQASGAREAGEARLVAIAARLRGPVPEAVARQRPSATAPMPAFTSGFTQPGFEAAVNRALDYIRAGDIMQVVLSQRLSRPFSGDPLSFYRALRTLNPSPYLFCMDFGDFHVVGSSPEILVRLEDGRVTVRPIAGTRPRGRTEEEDRALERELLADPKERAEHLMLIDLGRNDVGRVARAGSVELTEQMAIERYSHVMHIISNVTGEIAPGQDAIDVLKATFPAGTVSGAPKVRAMEIIEELEPVRRGAYSGAVGYLDFRGNMDTAIAIRTAVLKDGEIHVQAGAGIVADSVPASEWQETMNKARALMRAAELAENGLRVGAESAPPTAGD